MDWEGWGSRYGFFFLLVLFWILWWVNIIFKKERNLEIILFNLVMVWRKREGIEKVEDLYKVI